MQLEVLTFIAAHAAYTVGDVLFIDQVQNSFPKNLLSVQPFFGIHPDQPDDPFTRPTCYRRAIEQGTIGEREQRAGSMRYFTDIRWDIRPR